MGSLDVEALPAPSARPQLGRVPEMACRVEAGT